MKYTIPVSEICSYETSITIDMLHTSPNTLSDHMQQFITISNSTGAVITIPVRELLKALKGEEIQ